MRGPFHGPTGYDHHVRRTSSGWAFRRVAKLDADAIEHRLGEWLTAAGAARIDDGTVDATTTVLADDDAIFDAIAAADRPAPLISQVMTSTLLVSPWVSKCPLLVLLDRPLSLTVTSDMKSLQLDM